MISKKPFPQFKATSLLKILRRFIKKFPRIFFILQISQNLQLFRSGKVQTAISRNPAKKL